MVNGRGRGRTLTLALSQRERGFLVLRERKIFQFPKGERGDSWLSGERGIVSSPKGRGGILGSSEGEGLSAPQGAKGGRSDPLALWERVRVRVSHQGYAKGLSRSKGQG